MPSPALMTSPPDDASDLWDRPPGRRVRCTTCNTNCEPYDADLRICFLCLVSGHASFIFRANEKHPKAVERSAS